MSKQYPYGQPIYGQANPSKGGGYGTYEISNYQEPTTNIEGNLHNMTYQTYEEKQPIYYGQNQQYGQKVYYQIDQQTGQLYEYQQPEVQIPGYENYYEIQQPYQNVISQPQQKPQTIAQQQAKIAQNKIKFSKQIAKQKQNIQPPYISRNPHIKQQQYPQQQYQQQINPQYMGQQHFVKGAYTKEVTNQVDEGPQIESEFQPEIPIANSVLNQSKIILQPQQSHVPPPMQSKVLPQQSQNYQQSYVVPRRNPNLKLKQYEYYNNDSHFVTSVDPGSRTVVINPNINSMATIQKKDSKNISMKISGEPIPNKDSKISQKSLEANFEPTQNEKKNADELFNKDEQPIIGEGTNNIVENVALSGEQNIEKSEMINNEIKTSGNLLESKIPNEEIGKENPIEEKSPDENNINNLNNENDIFPKENNNQHPLEASDMGDIDDNLDHLPTINSIMKGNSEMLPPPKKKKYA